MKKIIPTVMAALLVMAISIPAYAANETIENSETEVVETVELDETAAEESASDEMPETVTAQETSVESTKDIGRSGSVKTLIFGSILISIGGVLVFVANRKGSGKKT